MLRLASRLHAEPPADGVGILRVEADETDEHRRGMAAFAKQMGFSKAPFGRARELSRAVRTNAWFLRKASRFDIPGFGDVLAMGRFAAAPLEQQRRSVTAPAASGDRITLVGRIRVLTPLAVGDAIGEALNRPSALPVLAYDDKAILLAAATPAAAAVLDWLQAALASGSLRFDERPDGFTLLAPGDPRQGSPRR